MNTNNFELFSRELLYKRINHPTRLPVKSVTHTFIKDLLQLLFPHYTEQTYFTEEEITSKINLLKRNLKTLLLSLNNGMEKKYEEIADKYFEKLPSINKSLWEDAEAIYSGDPAAESIDEVILAYPGFLAIAIYRFAHELYELNVPILPRVFTEYAHQITGIDIHPGAKIGDSFFIDHGTGIVIGETCQIGNNVKIYQGVTLGALSVQKKLANTKRHPTIEDDVIIYSNAVILGGDTVIGKGSVIGGNTWITKSLSPNSVVYNKNEIAFKNEKDTNEYLDFCI
ncbi:MAG: serine acetyltransferase [Melioribacteraceae bacterium]|jgi:serine O-acetyltransferase|nr:serine acetyltransferase [Melioribacteraceae bacterium]